ncbi:sucrose-6F-phosphate phosphohydrolase-domain-containing protein [Haematococcus lacustris]
MIVHRHRPPAGSCGLRGMWVSRGVKAASLPAPAVSLGTLDVSEAAVSTPSFQIWVRSGWGKGHLHGSLAGAPWRNFPLERVASSGKWLQCTLAAPSPTCQLEFVLTDGDHAWDKPATGGNYQAVGPGAYVVRGGQLSAVTGPAVMVVSDLDGTMVGDDSATAAFRQWWEEQALPRGCVLVYNTGRSLDSFKALLRDKAHCLAPPDALISAVGTKVYLNKGGSWVEDGSWEAQLEQGWRLEVVREACYSALAQVGKESMHFRPPDEQNKHKVTCGVAVSALARVLASLQQSLSGQGVRANIITSGHGDWKFVDLVPERAGKLQALEYVRRHFGFPVHAAVACGDSGNDILMLQGANPAIVVGNSQPDLLVWLKQRRAEEVPGAGPGGKERLFLAPQHEALSILAGLEYWGYK